MKVNAKVYLVGGGGGGKKKKEENNTSCTIFYSVRWCQKAHKSDGGNIAYEVLNRRAGAQVRKRK